MKDPLFELVQPTRLTAVVDIGANPIDGAPPYRPMLDRSICTVVGFDPQASAIKLLRRKEGRLETYLPYAIGDGSVQTLHLCAEPGMTGFLKPDAQTLSLFPRLPEFGQVIATEKMQTRALDSIQEIEALDFLKVDVQGSELAVFRSGKKRLAEAVVIQTEVSFLPLYEGQPTLGILDIELRSQGFIPHAQIACRRWGLSTMPAGGEANQILEADFVYVRDFRKPDLFAEEQLKHLALIAHHCYRSFDLAQFCLLALEERGCLPKGSHDLYAKILSDLGPDGPTPGRPRGSHNPADDRH
jgi:FkbM family methyltransferase